MSNGDRRSLGEVVVMTSWGRLGKFQSLPSSSVKSYFVSEFTQLASELTALLTF